MSSPDMWSFMKFKNWWYVYKMHDMHLGQFSVKLKKKKKYWLTKDVPNILNPSGK